MLGLPVSTSMQYSSARTFETRGLLRPVMSPVRLDKGIPVCRGTPCLLQFLEGFRNHCPGLRRACEVSLWHLTGSSSHV